MTADAKRQSTLLGLLGIALLAWAWFGGFFPGAEGAIDPADLPGIDAEGVARSLKGVSTVNTALINVGKLDTEPDRDLFQYGVAKPPPPDPAEVERQRRAAEEALKRQEEMAREQKAREGQQVGQGQNPSTPAEAQAALALPAPAPPPQPVVPAGPVRQPPPPINFRFMGVMGPPDRKVAVLVEGDSMLLARKGEVIQGKFRVLDIAVEWAEIGYTDPEHKDFRKRLNFGM